MTVRERKRGSTCAASLDVRYAQRTSDSNSCQTLLDVCYTVRALRLVVDNRYSGFLKTTYSS